MKSLESRINEITYCYEEQNKNLYKEFYSALKRLKKKTSADVSAEVHIIEEIFLRKTDIVSFAYKSGIRDACNILSEISEKVTLEIDSGTG